MSCWHKHVEPSPAQTPQLSMVALPPQVPEQSTSIPSAQDISHAFSFCTSPPHTPQTSNSAPPPHIPLQSISFSDSISFSHQLLQPWGKVQLPSSIIAVEL